MKPLLLIYLPVSEEAQGADTKRLDWLEKTATLLPQQRGAPATKRINFVFWEPEQSIREAIDIAMNQPADAGEKGGGTEINR